MEIADWRRKIDDLDTEIVKLISQRAEAAREIGRLKQGGALPVYEPEREKAVLDHVKIVNQGPLPDSEVQHIYERIMDVMRTLQKRQEA